MIDSRYEWKKRPQTDQDQTKKLAEALNLSELVAEILINRGYDTKEKAESFLKPGPENLYDPYLMHDMKKGTDRIRTAIVEGQKITVYGDYDADGLTSTSIMYEALTQLGAECDYYVPNRFDDGYGPNKDVYKRLIDNGTQLIVTVDNGVAGHEAIEFAKEQGVDVVITDHHELPQELPDAYAIIHPKIPNDDGDYPFEGLSGAGVAFKVATALLEEIPQEALDLCAIGTVADLVPLVDENRVLVKYGLEALRSTERIGLLALYEECGLKQDEVDEETIGFSIAPNLNALGRISDATVGVELLTTMDEQKASELAKTVLQQNMERQNLVKDITAQAQDLLNEESQNHLVNLVWGEKWHEGVLGIVASRLVESTGKPTIVLGVNRDSGLAKGSGRSVEAFNLFDALDGHRDLLEKFGGHHMACGLTVSADELPKLQEILDQEAKNQNLESAAKQVKILDGDIDLSEINPEMIQELSVIGPFGTNNPKPVFSYRGYVVEDAKPMGNGNHLRLNLLNDERTVKVAAVCFGVGNKIAELLANPEAIKFIGSLSINVWQNQRYPQIMIEDLKKTGISVELLRTNRLKQSMFADNMTYVFFTKELYGKAKPYLSKGAKSVLVCRNMDAVSADKVAFVDCPINYAQLMHGIRHIKAKSVRAIFYQNDNVYIDGIPSREVFAQVYLKIRNLDNYPITKNLDRISAYFKIKKSDLIFILKVFFDAGFVKIENGSLSGMKQIKHHNLEDTKTYQARKKRMEVERLLIAGSEADVKAWLLQNMQ